MKVIGWKERQRRIMENEQRAWEMAGHAPDDPGLHEVYGSLPRAPIRLICCPLIKDVNHGGLLRLAEAFRIEQISFSPEEDGAVDISGHRGSQRYQPFEWKPVEEAISRAKSDGFEVVAVTLSKRSVPIRKHRWRFPCAFVVGGENEGVPSEVENQCNTSVAIPLYGMVSSLNVTTAAAIALEHGTDAYASTDSGFEPARKASKLLIGR